MKLRQWVLREEQGGDGGEDSAAGGGAGGGEDALGTVEERAKRMGWAPKDDFKGDPARWVDAATYVKNGEESLPILRERNRKMERDLAEKDKALKEFKAFNERVEESAYKRAKAEIEANLKAATKAGDEAGVTQAAEELAQIERERGKKEAAPKTDPEFDGWVAENRWYTDDADLNEEAEAEAFRLRKRMSTGREPALEGVAFLDKVKANLKAKFPAKFGGNPRRQQGSGVEGSNGGGEPRNGARKGWSELPHEAKLAGEGFIKQGLMKDKAAYAAQYWSQFETA